MKADVVLSLCRYLQVGERQCRLMNVRCQYWREVPICSVSCVTANAIAFVNGVLKGREEGFYVLSGVSMFHNVGLAHHLIFLIFPL